MKKKKVKKANTITIGKPRVRKPIAKKVVVKKAIVKPKPVVKEYLSARYSFDIISIQTDAKELFPGLKKNEVLPW